GYFTGPFRFTPALGSGGTSGSQLPGSQPRSGSHAQQGSQRKVGSHISEGSRADLVLPCEPGRARVEGEPIAAACQRRLAFGALQKLGKAPNKGGEVLPDADLASTMFNALGDFWDRALESIEGRNKRGTPRQRLTPSSALQKIPYDHEDLMGILVVR